MSLKEKITQNIKYILPLAIFIILLVILYPFVSSLENKPPKEDFNKTQKKINEENVSDVDGDGLLDEIEFVLGMDAYSADTDKDGHSDYGELKNGHNPFIKSPDDKLNDDVNNLAENILFDDKEKKFSELDQLKIKLKDQPPNGLCDNSAISVNGLSDYDKVEKAVSSKDACICSKAAEDKYKNACYAELAGLTGNEILCKYIVEGSSNTERAKSKCLHNLMLATLNEKHCFEIKEVHDQANCFVVLALKTKKYNLCDSISDSEERDSCYWRVAIFSKNPSLCDKINPEKISGSDKESCLNMSKLSFPPKF